MQKRKKALYLVILMLVAIVFVTFFSYTTSPLYQHVSDLQDSAIFQIIGRYWLEGAVPYKDLWDLKGPFIFFINAVGYWLTDNRQGIWILQIIFLCFTLCTTFKTFLLYFRESTAFGMTLLSLASLAYVYQGGNMTAEYLLPFLTWSFYGILKWNRQISECAITTHPPRYAVLYGIVLGISLMSRLTNALAVCGAVIVIAITLLWHKAYRNLLVNIAGFIIGFAITTLPFFFYFYSQDALSEMWEGTFLHAFRYAGKTSKDMTEIGIHFFVLCYLNSILLLLITIWNLFRTKRMTISSWLWLMVAGLPFVWFCQGNGFANYGIIVYPLFAVVMIVIYQSQLKPLGVIVGILLIIGLASKVRFMFVMYHWENKQVTACMQFLKNHPQVNYDSFVAYNCDPNIYLVLDCRPAATFFSLQDFHVKRNPVILEEMTATFKKKQPQWILLSHDEEVAPSIQPILDDTYTIVSTDQQNNLTIYTLKR